MIGKDMREFLSILAVIFIIIGLLFACIAPILYFEGQAKAKWLNKTQDIEMPWYEAAFLDVQINNIDLNQPIKIE